MSNFSLKTLFSFATVGALTAIFYISFFSLLWDTFHLNYNVALSIAYVAAITLYFFANRRFTFQKHHDAMGAQLIKYAGMIGINYLITLGIVRFTVETLALPPAFGVIAAIGVTFILSFLLSKFWIFKTSLH